MTRKWIRLFQINDRSHLEQNLNKLIMCFEDLEILGIWTENGLWFASVRSSFMEQPKYSKPETLEASLDS